MSHNTNTRPIVVMDFILVGTCAVFAAFGDNTMLTTSASVQLFAALVVINLLDVVLPHGDSVDIDSALLIAAIYLVGPTTAAVLGLAARAVAHALSGGLRRPRALLGGLAKRAVGFLAAGPIWLLLSSVTHEGSAADYAALLVIGLVFVLTELMYGQLGLAYSRADSPLRIALSNLVLQGPVLASGVSVAILTVIVYEGMTVWGLALMAFLLLAMRQSFALLLDVRNAYHATIEALVGAMEAQRPGEKGVGDQVAILARRAGAEYGWFGSAVETLGYAALLHYFGLGFSQIDDSSGQERPTPLAEVRFFESVEPVNRLLAGMRVDRPKDRDVIAAYIVARSLVVFDRDRGEKAAAAVGPLLSRESAHRVDQAVNRAVQKATAE